MPPLYFITAAAWIVRLVANTHGLTRMLRRRPHFIVNVSNCNLNCGCAGMRPIHGVPMTSIAARSLHLYDVEDPRTMIGAIEHFGGFQTCTWFVDR
jgi:hypothetical protein